MSLRPEDARVVVWRRARVVTDDALRGVGLLFLFAWMAGAARAKGQSAAVQTQAKDPAFAVATIRVANRDDGRRWFGYKVDASGRLQGSAISLSNLVYLAYGGGPGRHMVDVDPHAPKWVSSEEFDVVAKVDDAYLTGWGQLSAQQRLDVVRPMVRQLLGDRFHVTLREETRKTPVYALVQAKGGAHVKQVDAPPVIQGDEDEAMTRWNADHPHEIYPGLIYCTGDKCTGHAVKMADAVGQIGANSRADRMVIDETGLTGYYDLSFRYAAANAELPMQEVGEDLGMRFEPRSVPMQYRVIVSADKPSVD